MSLSERLRSPGFWWTAATALLVVLLAAIPAARPGWFVESTGQITVVGGTGIAALLAFGLLLGWRWVRYLAVIFLVLGAAASALWVMTGAGPAFRGGHALLTGLALVAAGLLAFAPPVRSYFGGGGAT